MVSRLAHPGSVGGTLAISWGLPAPQAPRSALEAGDRRAALWEGRGSARRWPGRRAAVERAADSALQTCPRLAERPGWGGAGAGLEVQEVSAGEAPGAQSRVGTELGKLLAFQAE